MMVNQYFTPVLVWSLALTLFSCTTLSDEQSDNANEVSIVAKEKDQWSTVKPIYEKGDLKVYLAKIAKAFPEAKLIMEAPIEASVTKAGEYEFKFKVANYQLAEQTPMAEMRHCANSKKGQHIHYILNNAPYVAHYESSFKGKLLEGNNVLLAFLSRSYHESIKNGSAFVLKNFKIGDLADDFDVNTPHLFYSRPKGTYKGNDTKKILLDFYLLNSELSAMGNKVKVTIDEHEFSIDSWEPYFVEGLTIGKHTFRIQLVDSDGNSIEGPFNDSGNREIVLEE